MLRVKEIYLILFWAVDIKDENNAGCSSEVKSNTAKTFQVYLLSSFFMVQSGPDSRPEWGLTVCRIEQITLLIYNLLDMRKCDERVWEEMLLSSIEI